MDTVTPEPLTLTVRDAAYYPPEQRDRDHTTYPLHDYAMVFEDPEVAVDYLIYKGLTPERAALVIDRRCEFSIEPADGLRFRTYQFERSAR